MKKVSLLSVSLLLSCTTVKDITTCSVAGTLMAGGICSHSLIPDTKDLTFDEFVSFLEPQPANPADNLPAKGPAVCMASVDYSEMKSELESACRELGPRCSVKLQDLLQSLH